MKRFVVAPVDFVISSTQGAFVVRDGFVYGAETFGGKTSRSGSTLTPKLIEQEWMPGFRADQLPKPGHDLLAGRGQFVVFPVCNTGFDGNGTVVYKDKYTAACNAWTYFRDVNDAMHGIYEFVEEAARKYGIDEYTLRLARNATRKWPGANPAGCTWTKREVLDLVEFHGATITKDESMKSEPRFLVYCEARAVVSMVEYGFDDSNSPVTVWGVCNQSNAGYPELILTDMADHTDVRPYLKVWTLKEDTQELDWEYEPVEYWLLRHGTPYQPGLVEKSRKAYSHWAENVLPVEKYISVEDDDEDY